MSKTNGMRKVKGVWKDAKKHLEEFRKSGAWLERNIIFNKDLQLPDNKKGDIKELYEAILLNKDKSEQLLFDFEVLIINLIQQNKKPISISMFPPNYKISKYNKVSYRIIKLVHLLHKHKFLNMDIGYKTEKESRLTRIHATNILFSYCIELPPFVIIKPKECVILKDDKGKLKDYKDTAKTWRIRDILTKANEVNQAADIRCQTDRYTDYKMNVLIKAIFLEDFLHYGRLHSFGYKHYQGFGEDERKSFTIDGIDTTELDYSGLHPCLLYAKEGIQYSVDPYSVINDNALARPFLKRSLLRMLNAKDELTAERGINYMLRDNELRKELKTIGITRARPIIDKFKQAHAPIAKYFCSGKKTGLKIMNKDGMIALDVINHFIKQNIPILPVHDSFIVQEQFHDELREVMQQKYRKHTGGFKCKIK